MANMKTRLRAPKSAPMKTKRGGRVKQLTSVVCPSKSSTAMKRPSNLHPDSRKQNGDCFIDKVNDKSNQKKNNESVTVTKNTLMTRSGRITKKSKGNLKLFDNILKNELMIKDERKNKTKKLLNNNDVAISDQNRENGKSLSNIDSAPKKSRRGRKPGTEKLPPYVKKKSHKDTKNSQSNSPTKDDSIRENVISNMKSVLNLDHIMPVIPEHSLRIPRNKLNKSSNPSRSRKTISNDIEISHDNTSIADINIHENNSPKLKVRKDLMVDKREQKNNEESVENATQKPSKMKQVTLSNGVVLTLSLVQCDYCQKTFSNKSSLSRHMFLHLDLRPHACPHCPRKFRYTSTLKIHIQRRHPTFDEINVPEHYTCQICDKQFLMKENLDLHLASHVKNENSYKCILCDKKFSHRLLLIQHEKQHSVSGRYQCYLCNMNYDTRSRLAIHVKTHSKIKDYICQYCGKEFARLNSIKRHVQVCHGGHRIQCPICLKQLKGHLSEHMRVHEKSRPHECPECGKMFTQSTHLNVHRRSHTGARPYPCRICNRPFSHSNALMLHIRRHTGEKPFPCAMCPMSFSQLPHMKAHMSKIHGKEEPYKCLKCDKFFKLKALLEKHVSDCREGDKELSFEEKIQASVQIEEVEVESLMSLSKMRFLLALLLTMISSKEQLKFLGFNKRLIDDLLEESLEAMGHTPCNDDSLSALKRLKKNIEILLEGTVPKEQMEKFRSENKSTEELLVLLTDDRKNQMTKQLN